MTKVGSQSGNAGRAGWGSRSADGHKPGAKSAQDVRGQQAFQRVLDRGTRNFRQAEAGSERPDSRMKQPSQLLDEAIKSFGSGNERPAAAPAAAPATPVAGRTATYDTTRIIALGDFIKQFPEVAQAIKPFLAHGMTGNGNQVVPSIAIVNSSNASSANDVQRIGNTVFISGDAAQAATSGKLDAVTVDSLAAAIAHYMGFH